MKRIFILAVFLLSFAYGNAQSPQKMSFQAVIRNSSNSLVSNLPIGLRVSILQGAPTGAIVYSESQTANTNVNGLVTIQIGGGNVIQGDFSNIEWANGPYFIQTETDVNGGTNYTITSTSQLLSVPYALYAQTSGSSTPGPQGPDGPQGIAGTNGTNGIDGPQGIQGEQGPIGLTGPTGPQGAQGPQGIQGANGLSSYQVAVSNGFNGTQAQWLSSLVGSQGPQGVQGLAGQDGKNTLINTTLEPSGTNCPNGGTKVEVGLDNNSNGVLDISEINASQTKYVCNGAQGVAGPQGPAGTSSTSIGSNAAFSDAITTFNGDISYCGTYTSLAVSNNGKYIILGCQSFTPLDSNGNALVNSAGKVSVLKYENGTFENVGQEFIGTSLNDRFGLQVGISGDGLTIFFTGGTQSDCYVYKLISNTWVLHSTIPSIGFYKAKMNTTADLIVSLNNSGNTTQSITFYKLVGTNWVSSQFLANGILGNSDLQISNDGSIIALSNYGQNLGVLPNPYALANGRTGVFYYNGTTFTQKGNFIEGPNTRAWGYHFCLSNDGTKIGITTWLNFVTQDQTDPCYIRTYRYNTVTSLWEQYNNELVFKSNNVNGEITFFDFDSSSNYLIVAHKIESAFANEYKKSYFLLMKDLNNNWNQYGTRIEFIPTFIPDNFEFKSNIFFYVQDDKLRIKDFN